jgi:chromosome segregation ATPase
MTTDAQNVPNAPNNSPDHATARIVEELAAALLPHLKETVSAELTRTTKSLPINVDREVEEALASLKRLQVLFKDMEKTLKSVQSSVSLLSNELLPLSQTCETLNAASERLEQLAANPDVNVAETNELLRAIAASLSEWEGILKANGRAHTRELTEFSAEVSEQVSWMKSGIPVMVEEILKKTLSPRTEECRTADESARALDTRLARLEKIGTIILAEGIVFVAFLAAIAAALYCKMF